MRKIITIFILLSIMIFGENKTKTVEVVYSDFETMHLNTPIDVTFRIFQEGYIRIHETQTKYKNTFSVVFLIPQRSVYDYRHLVITVGDVDLKMDLTGWHLNGDGSSTLEYTLYSKNVFYNTFNNVLGKDMSMKIYGFNKEVLYDVKFSPEAMTEFWKNEKVYRESYIKSNKVKGGVRQ